MPDVASIASNQKTIEQIIAEQANKSKNTRNTGELGKNDFLQLLITQVQHQDPLDPQSDTDFIAQMAQFSALEQMQNLNNAFSMTKGFGMIGKYAVGQITNEDTGNTSFISGVVESVRVKGGKVYAIIDGQEVDIDSITDVSDTALGSANRRISDYSGLVGMLGSAYLFNNDGGKTTIKGIISSLEQRADGIYARLDEVDVKPYELDLEGFEGPEEYVMTYAGKEITIKLKDPETDAVIRVTGTLRDGYLDDSDKLCLILDDVTLPVDTIYSTERVDLYSSEHMLLQQILYILQDRFDTGRQDDDSSQDTEAPGAVTEPDPAETETRTDPNGGVG